LLTRIPAVRYTSGITRSHLPDTNTAANQTSRRMNVRRKTKDRFEEKQGNVKADGEYPGDIHLRSAKDTS